MGLFHSPRIVTDSLVLCLDAGNAKSYPGTGTVWNDLSGNGNTGTLINGPTYSAGNGGSFSFDGSNDMVVVTLPSTISFNTFTYNAWIRSTSNTGYRTIIDQDNDDWFFGMASGQFISYDPNYQTGYYINMNQWYNLCMSHAANGPVFFYVNGKQVYATGNDSTSHTTTYFGIGSGVVGPTTPSEVWSGNISQVSIYNRALSAAEINQNFNALRGRYGI